MRFIVPCNPKGIYLFQDYRLLFFVIGLFLYGLLGSPTPDQPGMVEIIIASLLIISVGVYGVYQFYKNLSYWQKIPKWYLLGCALFLYGISLPVIFFIYNDNPIGGFVRDIVGFLFLCLPLFLVPFVLKSNKRQRYFLMSILFIGLSFSIRVLFLDFSFLTDREELLYLANSPLVLFVALYLMVLGFEKTTKNLNPKQIGIACLCFIFAVLPMAAMYIDFQRASFFALGSGIFIFLCWGLIKRPLYMFVPLVIFAMAIGIFWLQITDIIENILVKTSKVGLNMRHQEAMAVWELVSSRPISLVFGQGWGANFSSPAVGGLNVNYTHSLITYMLLKTGLIGLGLTLVYLFFIFEKAVRLVFIKPVKGISLIWPFVIPIMLYASYKSLDYGLILALILTTHTNKAATA